jgi:hypothetical protein
MAYPLRAPSARRGGATNLRRFPGVAEPARQPRLRRRGGQRGRTDGPNPHGAAGRARGRRRRKASWLEQMDKSVRVGLPLLVHRRCAQPMFAISNEVAYAGKMVQAKEPKTSKVLEVLGPSRWLHVTGAGSGKWCAAEADAVVDLLRRLVDQGIEEPDIFFITPFRIVAQNMRSVLSASDAKGSPTGPGSGHANASVRFTRCKVARPKRCSWCSVHRRKLRTAHVVGPVTHPTWLTSP